MCYPKPGPRCSAHAAMRLTLAKRNFKHSKATKVTDFEVYEKFRKKLEITQKEYNATPAGIRELTRKVNDPACSYHHDLYQTQLNLGIALRKAQFAELKTEDVGDVKHMFLEERKETYLATKFPEDNASRLGVTHFNPQVEVMIKESEQWINELTSEEIETISWFTSNGANAINGYISTGESETEKVRYSKKILKEAIAKLDSSLAKFERKQPIVVYRGLGIESVGSDEFLVNPNRKSINNIRKKVVEQKFKEGTIFSTPVFMSTSIDSIKAHSFAGTGITLEILTRKAAPLVNVSAWDVTEKEMIIPREQQYKVHKVIKNPVFGGQLCKNDYLVQLIEL